MKEDIVIVSAARTAIGGFLGALAPVSAPQLGATAIAAAVGRAETDPSEIDEVVMGNVLSAGVGQAPARQAALLAGLPLDTSCATVSKVCGSGMKAVMLACDQICAGTIDSAVAGGMESMSQAPYLLPKGRTGQRLGHGEVIDHMFFDGLQNADDGQLMGCFADANAKADGITRQQMDEFATESLARARQAITAGYFAGEITPVTVSGKKGDTRIDTDEQPGLAKPEKIPQLKPAFGENGLVTAANASSISDGAAAVVLMSRAKAESLKLNPIAVVKAHSSHSQTPETFTHAPIGAVRKLLQRVGWSVDDVDLFEINEAFAMVTIAAMQQLPLPVERTNINGGATALGHPIGASGARILVTLLYALKRLGKKRGVASLCIGGGEATAIAVEMMM